MFRFMSTLALSAAVLLAPAPIQASYAQTVDQHPICKGSKMSGKCASQLNGVACSYLAWDSLETEYRKFYSTCTFDRNKTGGSYDWFHTGYIPWTD